MNVVNKIKTGQTFNVAIEIFNQNESKGVELNHLVNIKSIIFDANNKKIDDVIIDYMDQTEYPGWITLNVFPDKTKYWPEGDLYLSVKVDIGGIVLKTDSLKFFVYKDINE